MKELWKPHKNVAILSKTREADRTWEATYSTVAGLHTSIEKRHAKRDGCHIKLHLRPSKSSKVSKGKYEFQTELEPDDELLWAHRLQDQHCTARDFMTENDSLIDRHGKYRCTPDKYFPVIRPVNDRFGEALDYQAYCLVDNSSRYNHEVAQSVVK